MLVLNWQQKFDAKAKLKVIIEEAFDIGLPRAYTPELYRLKCEAVIAHSEKSYPERDRSVYSLAGLSSPPQQPEHQGQAGRNQQSAGEGEVDLQAGALNADVARQPSKAAAADQGPKEAYHQTGCTDRDQQALHGHCGLRVGSLLQWP